MKLRNQFLYLALLMFMPAMNFATYAAETPDQAVAGEELIASGALGETVERLYGPYDDDGGPGAIVAVLKGGRLLHLKGYGYANREFKARWRPDTPYTLYSTTKPMLAIALMRLEEAGRIDLDAPVRRYLPDFPEYQVEPTVRNFLQHTGGFWRDERLHFLIGTSMANEEISLDELYQMGIRQPALSFRPGTAQYYNDAELRLAGRVLEAVTGKSFDAAMREWVLGPAGMETAVHRPLSNSYRPGQASTYLLGATPEADLSKDDLVVPFLAVETAGDGGLLGTMRDYIAFTRFAAAPRAGGSYIERLAEPVIYGPGVAVGYRTSLKIENHRGLDVYLHGGLFGKKLVFVPELDAWIIIMCNAIGGAHGDNNDYGDIIDALMRDAGGYEDRFGPAGERRYGHVNPPDQAFTANELAVLTGEFLDPATSTVLRIREENGDLLHSYLNGPEGYLVRDGDDFVSWSRSSGEPIRIRVEDNVLKAHVADWGRLRTLTRLEGTYSASSDAGSLVGTYLSEAFGSVYHVEKSDQGLVLRINAGQRLLERYELSAIAPDVFETRHQAIERTRSTSSFQVAVQRDGQRVTGLTFNAFDVRGFHIRKVSVEAM